MNAGASDLWHDARFIESVGERGAAMML